MDVSPRPPPDPFFDRLDKDLPPEIEAGIRNFMLNNPQDPKVLPILHLNRYTPISIADGDMIPRYHSHSTRTGSMLSSRTFGTRAPNKNTAVLFQYFRRAPDIEAVTLSGEDSSGKLFIRGDGGVISRRLAARLQRYLSVNPVDRTLLHRTAMRQYLQDHDTSLFKANREAAVQGKSLFWDGAFINDFLAQASVFKDGQLSTFGLHPATSWGPQTAIADLLLYDAHHQCAASWEEKPKFHHSRMQDIAVAAAKHSFLQDQATFLEGFYIEHQGQSSYTSSLTSGTIVLSEIHVYIQAVEQCYAYRTRYCIISGHLGHQLVYLAKTNLLLVSNTILYSAAKDGNLTIAAACVALCLPRCPGEPTEKLLPSPQEIGLDYTIDENESATNPSDTDLASIFPAEGSSGQTWTSTNRDVNEQARSPGHREESSQVLDPDKFDDSAAPQNLPVPKALRLSAPPAASGGTHSRHEWRRLLEVRLELVGDYDSGFSYRTSSYPQLNLPTDLATPPASSLGSSAGSPPRVKRVPGSTPASPSVEYLQTPPNSASLETKLIDICPLDTGATCETFLGRWVDRGVDVVLKVVSEEARAIALHEAKVYALIGGSMSTLVPRFIGLYRSGPSAEQDFYVLATEYAGPSLADRHSTWVTLSPRLKWETWQLIDALHTLKIVHLDIQLRHLRVSPYTRKLCIIDFGRSEMNASSDAIAEEKALLAELLGYE